MLLTLILGGLSLASPLSQALQTGSCANALKLDPAQASPAQELALAKCKLAAGESRSAMVVFERLENNSTLAPYARYLHAEAAYQAEDYSKAAELLSRPLPFSAQSLRKVALLRGKALIQSGEYIAGRDAIRPILETKIADQAFIPDPMDADPAEARWWLAEGARLRGAGESGKSVLYRIWTDNPTSEYSEKAEKRLIAMGERIPDSTTETGRGHIKRRAASYKKLQHHTEAAALLDLLPAENTSPQKIAYSAFRAKDYATNILTFDYSGPPDLAADLVICLPIVQKEARAQRKTLEAHLLHLVVHGILHACGLDHESDDEADAMEALEARILARFRIADPYGTLGAS